MPDTIQTEHIPTEMTDSELLMLFVRHQCDAAFRQLVERHAGVVMSVCRLVLRDEHDAFQATFMILARRADRALDGSMLAGWQAGYIVSPIPSSQHIQEWPLRHFWLHRQQITVARRRLLSCVIIDDEAFNDMQAGCFAGDYQILALFLTKISICPTNGSAGLRLRPIFKSTDAADQHLGREMTEYCQTAD